MVCDRCIKAVTKMIDEIDHMTLEKIELGNVELEYELSDSSKENFEKRLLELGFELIDNEKPERMEQIKNLIINEIHHEAGLKNEGQNYSDFVVAKMGYDYSYLNELFSNLEGKTIGQFIRLQKIEKAKELLVYDQLNLAAIADKLEYNSAQYLSAQFKNITGMTPSKFKSIGKRKPLDQV